jgi:hypothetical protein
MPDLLRLPLRAADLALAPTRFVIRTAWGLLPFGHDDDDGAAPPVSEPPPADRAPSPAVRRGAAAGGNGNGNGGAATAAAPSRPAPPRRAAARPKPKASPKAARRAVRHEPTKGEAAAIREERREQEQAAGGTDSIGATISVAEPWEGYAAMSEDQVLERLTGADAATRTAVRLYEGLNANRQQVIFATDEPVAE